MVTPELLNRISEGDAEAFSAIYNEYCNKIYSIAYSVVKDEFEAEDIMQEVFIALPQKLSTLNNVQTFDFWLYRIAKNKALDFLKKNRPTVFAELGPEDDEYSFEDTIENENRDFQPEENLDYTETKQIIRGIIDSLPEEQRVCVILRFEKGYSLQEIADITGVPLATVKSRLKYGKAKIESAVTEEEKRGTKLFGLSGLLFVPFLRWVLGGSARTSAGLFGTATSSATSAISTTTTMAENMASATPTTATTTANVAQVASTTAANMATTSAKKAGISAVAKIIIASISSLIIATAAVAVINPNDILGTVLEPFQKSEVEKTIEKFEEAYNERDLYTLIELYPPEFQQKFKLELALTQGLAGFAGFGDLFSDELISAVFATALTDAPYLELEVVNEQYNETGDRVLATVMVSDGNQEGDSEIELVKIGDKWYFDYDVEF